MKKHKNRLVVEITTDEPTSTMEVKQMLSDILGRKTGPFSYMGEMAALNIRRMTIKDFEKVMGYECLLRRDKFNTRRW